MSWIRDISNHNDQSSMLKISTVDIVNNNIYFTEFQNIEISGQAFILKYTRTIPRSGKGIAHL